MEQISAANSGHMYGDLLPDDALRLVFARTSYADHIRLRLVCKSWKRLLEDEDIKPEFHRLPWIMFFDCHRVRVIESGRRLIWSSCKLYDPSSRKTYTVEEGVKSEQEGGKFVNAAILESKHGWVLFQQKHGSSNSTSTYNNINNATSSFFLYCPFTGETIDLPQLNRGVDQCTFSCSPTSKEEECVFFAFRYSYGRKDNVSIHCRGDQAWKTVEAGYGLRSRIFSVVYSNGTFYCLYENGALGALTVATQEWHLLCQGMKKIPWYPCFIEYDGQLTIVHEAWQTIFHFDFSKETWVEEAGHAWDGAVFGSRGIWSSNPLSISALGDAEELAGTVCLLPSPGISKYSLGVCLQRVDAYSNADELSGMMKRVWIQPPNT
ncbi:hypothetical protein Tsubulata_019753 [Turnera subulata]|uniref:F-box domain-containing protein n=1 Tax=Turnera subulata TaxID=218843 RepID=A0A9Q0JDR5_9ROSI|nr:hypothetical protein Tsubulata_019753 [Turnera subulata]